MLKFVLCYGCIHHSNKNIKYLRRLILEAAPSMSHFRLGGDTFQDKYLAVFSS